MVFDVYKKNSIKDANVKQIVPTCPIKQWGQPLSSGDFKNKVILFLLQQCKEIKDMLDNKIMPVTSGVDSFKLTVNSCFSVAELDSN